MSVHDDMAPLERPQAKPMPTLVGDQAQGLRQMFAAARVAFLALIHNPQVEHAGVAMERLAAAFAEQGLHTLVLDCADSAAPAHELAAVDLGACVQSLSPQVSYLAARGLAARYGDARGSSAALLGAAADAAPHAQVVLVHASASTLWRLFTHRSPRPLLLAADHPNSLTEAYAGMKLLHQRLRLMSFDLIITANPQSERVPRIAARLADTAERFIGVALNDWAQVDPAAAHDQALSPPLRRLARGQLQASNTDLPLPPPQAVARGASVWRTN